MQLQNIFDPIVKQKCQVKAHYSKECHYLPDRSDNYL